MQVERLINPIEQTQESPHHHGIMLNDRQSAEMLEHPKEAGCSMPPAQRFFAPVCTYQY